MSGMMLSILPVVGLVGASNLSTAIIILGIAVTLIFVASPRYAQFIWMAVSGVGFLGIFLALESYRLERLAIWRNPEKYAKRISDIARTLCNWKWRTVWPGAGKQCTKTGIPAGSTE